MKAPMLILLVGCLIACPLRASQEGDALKEALRKELLKALAEEDEEDAASMPAAAPQQRAKAQPTGNGAAAAQQEPPATAESTVEPFGALRKDLFPSVVLATATMEDDGEPDDPSDATHYGDSFSWAGVLIRNAKQGDKYTVQVECDGLIKPSKVSFVIKKSERLVTAAPKLKFDFDALAKVSQTRPVNMTFKVTRNGQALDDIDQTWQVHQVNDCPFYANVPTPKKNGKVVDEPMDIRFMFAAYVNENHPFVDQILKEAKATGLCNSFHGYQGSEQDVINQVNAIWVALQRRGITYSSITATTPSKGVYTQHVRFLDESISATQANCVDGSVLMASILKKIEIKTQLVLVPSHCYLAFFTNEPESGGKLIGLETTMLGSKASLPQAVQYATVDSEKSLSKNAQKFEREGSGYLLVDIDAAREAGIMPIPYVKGGK